LCVVVCMLFLVCGWLLLFFSRCVVVCDVGCSICVVMDSCLLCLVFGCVLRCLGSLSLFPLSVVVGVSSSCGLVVVLVLVLLLVLVFGCAFVGLPFCGM